MVTAAEKPSRTNSKRKELEFIRGSHILDVPVTIYEKGEPIGYKWERMNAIDLIRRIPIYDPFAAADDYYFDSAEWDKVITFIVEECVYPEGKLTGKPFIPELWQAAVYANIYCWKHKETNIRRYKEVFIFVPRKNGKTVAFGSIITLYEFFCSSEKRGQLYAAAADIEQASLNFRHTRYMIETNPRLISRLKHNRVHGSQRSFEHNDGTIFKVLSSVADTKHGLSPSFIYVDEIHAHQDGELIDVLLTGTGARHAPLTVYTTTSDFDRPSACNILHDKALSIAEGKQIEPEFLPVIYEADIDDDYMDEKIWEKCNPCLGKSLNIDYFRKTVRNAKNNPLELNRVLRLHFNIRTKTETAWIPPHIWRYGNANLGSGGFKLLTTPHIKEWMSHHPHLFNICSDTKFELSPSVDLYIDKWNVYWSWFIKQFEALVDEECYIAYDNASVCDIASIAVWFPRLCIVLHFGWCPATSIFQRAIEQKLPYDAWYQAGVINATETDSVDENAVLSAIIGNESYEGLITHFRGCREVVFDNWNAHHVYSALKNMGYPCRVYPQSFNGMNEPCKKMEALATDKSLFHGGNPVLEWMIGNVVIQQARDGKVRPDKTKSTNKIDGITAVLMAMGGWMYPEVETITEIRGLR